jgi:hypothetical protein
MREAMGVELVALRFRQGMERAGRIVPMKIAGERMKARRRCNFGH